jgi:hypothetical protein
MTQTEVSRQFSAIGQAEFDTLMIKTLTTLSMDMGKKLPPEEMAYMANRIGKTIQSKYRNWRVVDFYNCLTNGKIGNYAGKSALPAFSVATIEAWMARHSEAVQSTIIEEQKQTAAYMRNQTATMLTQNRDPIYAEAVLWRHAMLDSYRPKTQKIKEWERYEAIKFKVCAIPFCKIVDAVRNGTTNALLTNI